MIFTYSRVLNHEAVVNNFPDFFRAASYAIAEKKRTERYTFVSIVADDAAFSFHFDEYEDMRSVLELITKALIYQFLLSAKTLEHKDSAFLDYVKLEHVRLDLEYAKAPWYVGTIGGS